YLKLYGHSYAVIRNISRYEPDSQPQVRTDCIIYQGAVNEGRCFEQIIPAMKKVALPLYVFGDGNFLDQAKRLCMEHGVLDKVIFKEKLPPQELKIYTQQARLGINLVEHTGKSYYLSLSNRFFDYIHAGTPQLCMNFPAYRHLNDQYNVAIALDSG